MKVGFYGVAHVHADSYARTAANMEQLEVVGVADRDPKRAEEFAQKHGLKAFEREALAESSDALIVASENVNHAEDLAFALHNNLPVLCEKPLFLDSSSGEELVVEFEQRGLPLMTAFPCRYSSTYTQLEAEIRGGSLGAVLAVCATNRGKCPFGWFVEKEHSGGGAIVDHTVHVVDILRSLLVREIVWVYASAGHNRFLEPWEDAGLVHLGFEGEVFATLDTSWDRPDNFPTWGDVMLNIVCEKGVATVDLFRDGLLTYRQQDSKVVQSSLGDNLDRELLLDFYRAVTAGTQLKSTGRDGLQATRVVEAAYESLRTNRAVSVR